MKAREFMRRDVEVVTPNESIVYAAELMHYAADACVPVVRDRASMELVGILTGRDIAVRCVARRHRCTCLVGAHMTPMPLYTLRENDDIARAVEIIDNTEVRRIPVVSDDGVLVGVIRELELRHALRAGEQAYGLEVLNESRLQPVIGADVRRVAPSSLIPSSRALPADQLFHETGSLQGIH
jgi:CBS domain-containing protein